MALMAIPFWSCSCDPTSSKRDGGGKRGGIELEATSGNVRLDGGSPFRAINPMAASVTIRCWSVLRSVAAKKALAASSAGYAMDGYDFLTLAFILGAIGTQHISAKNVSTLALKGQGPVRSYKIFQRHSTRSTL